MHRVLNANHWKAKEQTWRQQGVEIRGAGAGAGEGENEGYKR
jgi:hypothetical protein